VVLQAVRPEEELVVAFAVPFEAARAQVAVVAPVLVVEATMVSVHWHWPPDRKGTKNPRHSTVQQEAVHPAPLPGQWHRGSSR
jgi:hypothetical protein